MSHHHSRGLSWVGSILLADQMTARIERAIREQQLAAQLAENERQQRIDKLSERAVRRALLPQDRTPWIILGVCIILIAAHLLR